MKANVGELEEMARELFPRKLRKNLPGVVQEVSEKNRFLVRFQDGCENDITSTQLTVVAVDKSPVGEETWATRIADKSDETVP